MAKPLAGYQIVEFAGIGAGPYAGMLLADLGAEVTEINRTRPSDLGIATPHRFDLLRRGRRSISIDLKTLPGAAVAEKLVDRADALIDPFRPGVLERLGLGPDECLARNPNLVFGRMTGFGQTGPWAKRAGHDLNYIALAGVLGQIGPKDGPPTPPLNLVGDFGGGGMLLALGILAGLLSRGTEGHGSVVDASMVDGAAQQMTMFFGHHAAGIWQEREKGNILDGSAPFYRSYLTSDNRWVAVAAIENKFYEQLIIVLDLQSYDLPDRNNKAHWGELSEIFARKIALLTLAQLMARAEGYDACVAPVLGLMEAHDHPHNLARETFVEIDGIRQPAPALRFNSISPTYPNPPPEPGANTKEILAELGFDAEAIAKMIKAKQCGYNEDE